MILEITEVFCCTKDRYCEASRSRLMNSARVTLDGEVPPRGRNTTSVVVSTPSNVVDKVAPYFRSSSPSLGENVNIS